MEKENMNPEVIRNLQDAGCDAAKAAATASQ